MSTTLTHDSLPRWAFASLALVALAVEFAVLWPREDAAFFPSAIAVLTSCLVHIRMVTLFDGAARDTPAICICTLSIAGLGACGFGSLVRLLGQNTGLETQVFCFELFIMLAVFGCGATLITSEWTWSSRAPYEAAEQV